MFMHEIHLYEKKIIQDNEFPVQIFENNLRTLTRVFPEHWHEHVEMHYILRGQGMMYCNHKPFHVKPGSLTIINSNELHTATTITEPYDALVLIFEMDKFSKEIANHNMIFQTLIESDPVIQGFFSAMHKEKTQENVGFKLAIKGKIYELLTYLMRSYVVESISDKEQLKRNKNLTRLNTVFQYIQNNYTEPLSNKELAKVAHLSEYRFCHLFKESMGQSPLNYIHDIRLKKAYHFLTRRDMTIAEVASMVGFQDYNNFGRLFRKKYGIPPSKVWELESSAETKVHHL